ncbi:MAG: TonB-dependent receptor [Bacteroidia bacterium]|jgi:TonB-linked SusC/RagA family outer membrane protein|nr:TonB-dependent receptor [Bacteroidia bacterium]
MIKNYLLTFMLVMLGAGLMAQTITGTVRDKSTGEALPGASVYVQGTTLGTVTDIDGKYKLEISAGTVTISASFVGYKNASQRVVAAKGQSLSINWQLEPESLMLDELVVIGYGVQQKSVVTGAISGVRAKDIQNMPVTRLEQALQGRTSGLTIAASSGQPGAGATVRVRGTTTINNSDPLYIVDGVPVDVGGLDYLNAADIESVEVLKDAASAAIYGARAANGVIIVTTRKGSPGDMKIEYHSYLGTQSPAKKLDLLNATDYAKLRNESLRNAGLPEIFSNPESLGKGTDWQSVIFNNNAMIQNHELSISGGTDRSTYYFSFGYLDQEGIVATDISHYKRLNLRINATNKVNNWLRFGNNFGYSHIKSKGSLNTNSEFGGPLSSAINLDPVTPLVITDPTIANAPPYSNQPVVRDANGNPYGISQHVGQELTNPMAYIATRLGNYGWSDNFVGNLYAEIEPAKYFRFRSDLGTKLAFWGDESFTPVHYLNAATVVTNNSYYRARNMGFSWNFENTLTYARKIGLHDFSALVGTSAYVSNSSGVNATYKNLPVNTFEDASMNYGVADANKIGGGWESPDHRIASIFARGTYNYDGKYLFTGILRRDGSSRFGTNNKFGYFPSASLGWNVTNEPFWPQNKIVNYLKIRGSYGVTGNDQIGDFQYLSTVGSGRDYTFSYDNLIIGYSPNAPSNPDLKWEETSQANIGFEATLLDDFRLVFDLYDKRTKGMLQPIILPAYVGANGSPTGNVASMTNKGFELELSWFKRISDLNLELKGNTSYLKNEITDLGTVEFRTGANFHNSTYEISRLMVGYPIGAFYGFEVLGVFQSLGEIQKYKNPDGTLIQPNARPGDFKYADLNKDGKIDAADRKIIGDPTPTWSFGFTVNASYKQFDLVIFGQGVAGNQIFNGLRRLDVPGANWTSDALNRWTGVGTSSTYPRLVLGDPNKNFANPSTFHLSNGSYVRIKTVQVGYTIPRELSRKAGIQRIRVYAGSNNLLTFTKYSGFDPEIGGSSYGIDRGFYPQARSFMAGINVTL